MSIVSVSGLRKNKMSTDTISDRIINNMYQGTDTSAIPRSKSERQDIRKYCPARTATCSTGWIRYTDELATASTNQLVLMTELISMSFRRTPPAERVVEIQESSCARTGSKNRSKNRLNKQGQCRMGTPMWVYTIQKTSISVTWNSRSHDHCPVFWATYLSNSA